MMDQRSFVCANSVQRGYRLKFMRPQGVYPDDIKHVVNMSSKYQRGIRFYNVIHRMLSSGHHARAGEEIPEPHLIWHIGCDVTAAAIRITYGMHG